MIRSAIVAAALLTVAGAGFSVMRHGPITPAIAGTAAPVLHPELLRPVAMVRPVAETPKPVPFKAPVPASFATAAKAQAYCPKDAVIWGNPKAKAYQVRGDKYFGKTKSGAFMCEPEALRAGYHTSGVLPPRKDTSGSDGPGSDSGASSKGPAGGDKGLEFRLKNNL